MDEFAELIPIRGRKFAELIPIRVHKFAELIPIRVHKFADQVIERGEKIDSLVQKSEGLGHQVSRRYLVGISANTYDSCDLGDSYSSLMESLITH